MKWSGLQVERIAHLRFIDSLFVSLISTVVLILGSLGVVTVVLNLFFSLPTILIAFAVLAIAAGLAVGSWSLYISYLHAHQNYLITPKLIQANPLNGADFSLLEIIGRYRRSPTWRGLLKAASSEEKASLVLLRLGITPNLTHKLSLSNNNNEQFVNEFLRSSKASANSLLTVYDLLESLLTRPELATVLQNLEVSAEEVINLTEFYRRQDNLRTSLSQMRLTDRHRTGGFAKDWAVSYTALLDELTQELTPALDQTVRFTPLFSREDSVTELIAALSKASGQNVLIVGEPGVGKKEVFYHLAAKILNYQTRTALDGSQVRLLKTQRLLSAAQTHEELAVLVNRLFAEIVRAGNVILFVDQFEILLDPGGKLGSADISEILEALLSSPQIHLVGTISPSAYISLVKNNPLLQSKFSTVELKPPSAEEALQITLSYLPVIENRHQVFFLWRAVKSLVDLGGRYLKDIASPSRELALAEEVANFAQLNGRQVIQEEDVEAVVERKAKVPVRLKDNERQSLLQLDTRLHKRIIGQDRAIKQLSDALLRARAGLSPGDKPLGSFLFLGPTGVGKTETAKALAEIYFGSPERLIRLDLTEYADETALQKLLGTDPVNQPGALTVAIQNQPSAVVLLDEVEKSHPQIKNVLLQLVDEGRLTTNFGKVLDFTNTIIIATSNAGSDHIKTQVTSGQVTPAFEKQLLDSLINEHIFAAELLNRFDGIIVFSPLTKDEMKQVVQLQLKTLAAELLTDKKIGLEVAPQVIEQLAQKGYDPVFGARALQRVMKSELETAIAREIIAQQPKAGTKIVVSTI